MKRGGARGEWSRKGDLESEWRGCVSDVALRTARGGMTGPVLAGTPPLWMLMQNAQSSALCAW